jgi:hypothetical protein
MADNHSEVARLLAQISTAYEAAQQGLTGLASGMARHTFINARLEHISEYHDSLRTLVGEQAIVLIAQALETLPDAIEQTEEESRQI